MSAHVGSKHSRQSVPATQTSLLYIENLSPKTPNFKLLMKRCTTNSLSITMPIDQVNRGAIAPERNTGRQAKPWKSLRLFLSMASLSTLAR